MKKLFLLILCAAFVLWPSFQASAQEEKIDSFKTIIDVQKDGSFTVTEEIVYDFGVGEEDHHGIYRTIPYQYSRRGNSYNLRLEVKSVTNSDGADYNYTTRQSGGRMEVKIGDANALVSGKKTYVIKYRVWRGLNYFEDHDELYWNTSGNEWPVQIMFHEAEVRLPKEARNGLMAECFTGELGSQAQDCSMMKTNEGYYFSANNPLAPDEGMTVVVGWNSGVIAKPGLARSIYWFVLDNWGLLLPLPTLILLIWLWRRYGKDEPGQGTIIARYAPPEGLNPAEVGTAVDGHPHMKDLSATIIDLARQGYLKIKYIEKKRFFGKERDYELIKLKPADSLEKEFDREFMEALFGGKESVKISSLKNKFYKKLPKLSGILIDKMMEKKYFTRKPANTKGIYISIGIGVIILGAFVGVLFGSLASGAGVVLCGVMIAVSSVFMVKRTRQGSIIREEILGFRDFLKVTETDRLKFHNAPAKNPEMFEEFLAYAMVLGVEKEWAEQFKDIYTSSPEWYEGDGHAFTTAYFVSSLSGMNTSARSAMAARPGGGAGSGSSGFSGGGFSGGGFGGGGGGSW